jgi:hypothetical protein
MCAPPYPSLLSFGEFHLEGYGNVLSDVILQSENIVKFAVIVFRP